MNYKVVKYPFIIVNSGVDVYMVELEICALTGSGWVGPYFSHISRAHRPFFSPI